MLDEAVEIARTHRLSVTDVELGTGALLQFEGEVVQARGALERALTFARARGDSWRESVAVMRLAMLAVEHGEWAEARARAAALREVATKYGDGTEGLIADALDALALHGAGDPTGRARVTTAADALARADTKAMLAFVLTRAAETEQAAGAHELARDWAARALAAAQPMGRPSAIVLAHSVLGRLDLAAGAAPQAAGHFSDAAALSGDAYSLSKRARDALQLSITSSSNAGTNASPLGGKLRRGRR